MAASSRAAPFDGPWKGRARAFDDWLREHKVVVSATSASIISTFAGFPLDSLKSRLQSSRESIPLPRLAAEVIREEGVGGLWRGFPLPLITISIVRTISFTIYTSTKRILNSVPDVTGQSPAQSESKASPWLDVQLNVFNKDTATDVAITSLIAGGASGAVVCVGSAPFELVKVRRQLEYQIYRDSHPELFGPKTSSAPPSSSAFAQHPSGTSASAFHHYTERRKRGLAKAAASLSPSASTSTATAAAKTRNPAPFVPPTTMQAVRMIVGISGWRGLYTGWRLHFIRDTVGTALYFAEYDVMRWILGRKRGPDTLASGREDEQGPVPEWARGWLPKSIIPFVCGSVAGVTSWALIYPVDAIKTKDQQRALSGLTRRTPLDQFIRLVRGQDKENPKPLLTGIARLYRGLGVSMVRSMLTHGLLWSIVDAASKWIETRPFERLADEYELA